jgi:cytochrome c2
MPISFLRQLVQLRIRNRALSFPLYFFWIVVSGIALITLPALLRMGVLFWDLSLPQLIPIYVVGAAYLMYSLILFYASKEGRGLNIYLALVFGVVCFLLSIGVLHFIEDLEFSRLVLLVSIASGIVLAIYPLLLNRFQFLLSLGFFLFLLMAVGAWIVLKPRQAEENKVEHLISALYVVDKVSYQSIPNLPQVEGGAIIRYEDGFIVVTGDGQFYQISWSSNGNELVAVKLPLASPLAGRSEFYAKETRAALQFRVTDLLVQSSDDGDQLFVAHQIWDRPDNCFRMGVSRTTLPEATGSETEAADAWTTLFETNPCIEQPFDTVETGGRLAWVGPDKMLMTVGDHGNDGLRGAALAQDPNADYGKVLLLDTQGNAEILTSGHRNPQGLLVDRLGQAWVTEHGPAGGDELNLLSAGQNYGWPLVTYGTDYSQRTWPLNPDAINHGEFTEPVHALVPGVAISNLVQLSDQQFPRWDGDFLIGSLRMETLYRVRLRDNRVIYVEPIFLGKRVRDMVEGADGKIFVWSDDETITVLSRRVDPNSGEDIFTQCRRCHESVGKAKAIAPNLKGIVGRNIASRNKYPYSESLKAVEGVWTEENLMEFLQNPQQFAPGNAMGSNAVPDDADRAALIQYLKSDNVDRQ